MKNKLFIISILFIICYPLKSQVDNDSVTIQGYVNDYDNNPLDSVSIFWQNTKFEVIKETLTDKNGYYKTKIKKGRYYSMGAINMSEYPNAGSILPEKDQRLEFWAWNFIADKDTIFNMKYHRMEVYGINVFHVQGGGQGYTIFCRPMSLTKAFTYQKNKTPHMNLSPPPNKIDIKITINDEEVPLQYKQEIIEYFDRQETSGAYLISVGLPTKKNPLLYDIFRIQITDLENGDKGEGVYFLEKKEYIN